ncbi:reverse transcriptase domain-containing protein [Tanacetum coccineum]
MPLWLCMKGSSFMLMLFIPGPKSPGKDIDVYLRPLIDDLKVLWALKGVETIDVATGQKFNMRAMVLWTINDFPARSSLSGWSGQGYKACPTCIKDTPFVHTAKARQDLKRLGIQSGLWLGQTKNGKCSKPQAAYSFTPKNRKKFCQFIKGVKLPDGFGSNFKHKVTDNDTNITGLKSHDCYIMMQRLLPYGLQQYLLDESKVVDILCNLKLIYPPAFFDIMIHLVIHLPLEALEGGPIRPWWMFPFERFIKKLKGVSATSELFALACGPTSTPISVNSCVVNGVKVVVHNRDERRTTQNSGICSPHGKDEEMYYGQLQEILEFLYLSFKVVLFRVKWFDTSNEGRKVKQIILRNNMTQILTKHEAFKDDQYILATQVKQCFYLEDMARRQSYWKVVEHVNHKKFSDVGVIVVEEDPDMLADVARGHGGDGGGDDSPPTYHIPTGCGGCFVNRGKGTRKPNLGGRKAGRLHTRQETRNLGLKKITDDKGPVPIRFEWDDKKTLMPLGEHASHWSNYLGELIREMPLYYPSWQKVPAERKAAIVTKIGRWTYINAGIQQHLQKLYNTNKASLKATHWVMNPETGTYDVESIREQRPESITPADWDAQITFWNDPRNLARAAQNRQKRAKSTVVCRQRSRSLARLRDQMIESSATREYPSLIHTFFVTHTVNGVFTQDEDRAIYEEMLRLQALGSNTETGVPYTEEEIMAIVRKGKQRGHLPGVGRVLPGRATNGCSPPPQSTVDPADVEKLKKSNKSLTKHVKMTMRLFRSDDKFSNMLDQFEPSPEFGGASGSGGCGDDEPGGDEDDDEDDDS